MLKLLQSCFEEDMIQSKSIASSLDAQTDEGRVIVEPMHVNSLLFFFFFFLLDKHLQFNILYIWICQFILFCLVQQKICLHEGTHSLNLFTICFLTLTQVIIRMTYLTSARVITT